jgi:hypothetical protein
MFPRLASSRLVRLFAFTNSASSEHGVESKVFGRQPFSSNRTTADAFLVLPTLLDCLLDTLCVFFPIVLVEVRRFDVGRRASIRIVKQTVPATLAASSHACA